MEGGEAEERAANGDRPPNGVCLRRLLREYATRLPLCSSKDNAPGGVSSFVCLVIAREPRTDVLFTR